MVETVQSKYILMAIPFSGDWVMIVDAQKYAATPFLARVFLTFAWLKTSGPLPEMSVLVDKLNANPAEEPALLSAWHRKLFHSG